MVKRGFLLEKKPRKNRDGPLRDPRSEDRWNVLGVDRLGTEQGNLRLDPSRSDTTRSNISSSASTWDQVRRNNTSATSAAAEAGIRPEVQTPTTTQTAQNTQSSFGTTARPVDEVRILKDTSSTTTTAPISSVTETKAEHGPNLFFQDMSEFLPNKTVGVPRAALAAWYGKKPRCHQVTKENYITWNDGGMSHNQRYTSLFVCPLTGEVFCSGEYGNPDKYEIKYYDPESGREIQRKQEDEEEDGDSMQDDAVPVVWYKQKTLAEHGAAARAYDCFFYRRTSSTSNCLGRSRPYRKSDGPPIPPFSPTVQQKIQELQERVQNRMEIEDAVEVAARRMEEEQKQAEADLQRERDEYRAARLTSDMEHVSMEEDQMALDENA